MSAIKRQRFVSIAGLVAIVGTVLSPVVASAVTASTTVNAAIGSAISVASSGTVLINLTPTAGGVVSSASDTILVSTNNTLGYALTLADTDATTTLVSGANTIPAHAGTQVAPTALAVNTWGYAVPAVGGFDATYAAETNAGTSITKWAGMPATSSPNTLKTTSTTASSDSTIVWYGVKVNSTKPNGTYSDTVTYTATTN